MSVLTLLLVALGYLVLAFGLFAVVDAALRPTAVFPAAGKLTKPAWVAILAVADLVLLLFGFLGLLGIVGLVAVIVYLVDARPALRELQNQSGPPYLPGR